MDKASFVFLLSISPRYYSFTCNNFKKVLRERKLDFLGSNATFSYPSINRSLFSVSGEYIRANWTSMILKRGLMDGGKYFFFLFFQCSQNIHWTWLLIILSRFVIIKSWPVTLASYVRKVIKKKKKNRRNFEKKKRESRDRIYSPSTNPKMNRTNYPAHLTLPHISI